MENSTRKLVKDNEFEEDSELKAYVAHLNFIRRKDIEIVRGAFKSESATHFDRTPRNSEAAPTDICTTVPNKITGKSTYIP